MTHDGCRNLDIEYNVLNLPAKVCRESLNLVNYRYLSDGTKLSCLDSRGDGYEYLGSLVYERKDGHLRLESTPFSGGRFVAVQTDSPRMLALHHISDHLGSTRVVVDSCGVVRERNDYYAFGKRWDDPDNPVSDNRYLFNGKEAQIIGATGWLDYGARMYDPELGRWFVPDPMAEDYYATGPYVYTKNNPERYMDDKGAKIVLTHGKIMWENGNWTKAAEGENDTRQIGEAVMLTEVGKDLWKAAAESKDSFYFSLSDDISKPAKDILCLGVAHTSGHPDNFSVKIQIFLGSINEYIRSDKKYIDWEKQVLMQRSTPQERIGAVGTHEITHGLDKKIDTKREARAIKKEKEYLNEVDRKRPIIVDDVDDKFDSL